MKTKNQLKGIITVLMATVVGLTGLTVGYGLWSDSIDVVITTNTTIGDFTCFGLTQASSDDKGPPPGNVNQDSTIVSPIQEYIFTYRTFGETPGGSPVSGEIAKDVAYTNAFLPDPPGGGFWPCGAPEAEVTVVNAYPSYASATTVTFTNVGPDTAVTITEEGVDLPESMTDDGYYLQSYTPDVVGAIEHTKCYILRKLAGPGHGPIGVGHPVDGHVEGNTPDPSNDPLDIADVPELGAGGPFTFGAVAPATLGDDDGDGIANEDPALMDLCWINFEGAPINPGNTVPGELKLHVLQQAEQNVGGPGGLPPYSFRIWVVVWPS